MPGGAVHVILNARSGRGHDTQAIDDLHARFAARGLDAIVHPAADGGQILSAARDAVEKGADIVVAAGGDGTVSAVASCVHGSDATLGVLPIGTLNHFARDLGIPSDTDEAIDVIAAGHRVAVDLGEVNGRVFVNNASLGLYPDIVRDRTRQQRRLGRGKYHAMAWAIHAVLRRSPFLRLTMKLDDGEPVSHRAPFVFIGNNDYVMEGFSIGMRESVRDGRLSIYTTTRRTRWGLFGLVLRALFGRLQQAHDFVSAHATCLTIDSHRRRLLVATDGEVTALDTPLEFRVLRGALPVLVPGG